MISAARSLSRLLRGSRRWLVASVVITFVQALLLVAGGLLVRRAFDVLIADDRTDELVAVGAALFGLAALSTALGLWTRHLVLAATKSAVRRLRVALAERVGSLPAAWFDRHETAQVHSTIVQDTERVDVMSNALAGQLVPAALISSALFAALLVIQPLLLAVVLVPFPLGVLASRRLSTSVRRRTRIWHRAFDDFSARVLFGLRARTLIRTQTAEELEADATRGVAAELSRAGHAMAWAQAAYSQLNGLVGAATGVAVLVVGGAAVGDGRITLGSLVAFYALLALLRGQLAIALVALPQVVSGTESLDRLEALLDEPAREPYHGSRRIDFDGAVALRDVHFAYRKGEPILRGVDLEIAAGERVAIVGPNGSGKSTIAALLVGFYRPDVGGALASGVPYDELDMRELRRRIAVVPQDPILFPGTIADNIAYGVPDVDEALLRAAAQRATADDFIAQLPRGYETQVGDEGGLLSGGQRQRIAIARALLRDFALLILDEPTSAVDRAVVSALLAGLRELPGDPAILLIAHEPAVVAEADRVYELDAGVLQEPGERMTAR
jgi:ABC-type multidrug transport system fused ATPase/permease subunit